MVACRVSPCQRWLAFTVDSTGDERCHLAVRDLLTGEILDNHWTEGVYSVEWAADGRTLYYTQVDHLLRPYRQVQFFPLSFVSLSLHSPLLALVTWVAVLTES